MITDTPSAAGRQIARAAGTVMLAFLFTQLIGLLRGVLILRAFGAGAETDSFNAANRVTELLFNLMAGGALGSAFIPTFTGLLAREERARAWKLASSIANLLLVALTCVALVAYFFAPQIVRHGLYVLSPGESIGQEALTVSLLRILLPSVVIFGLSGLVMGILNAHQRFWLPAIAPAMYSLGQIAGVLLLPQSWGIQRLAYGALLGALLHLLVQLPSLLRLNGRYSPALGLRMTEVRQVMVLMGPRVLGVAVVQLNFIVNTIIADDDAPGRHRPIGGCGGHAHLFGPGRAGQTGRAACFAGRQPARGAAAGPAGLAWTDRAAHAVDSTAVRKRNGIHYPLHTNDGLGAAVVCRRAGGALTPRSNRARLLRLA
jgi:putative peptidoglycan lipid II flippase